MCQTAKAMSSSIGFVNFAAGAALIVAAMPLSSLGQQESPLGEKFAS
jgi:hypothetical protein